MSTKTRTLSLVERLRIYQPTYPWERTRGDMEEAALRIETLERSVADLRSALDRVSAAWDECLSSGCNIGDAERIMSGPIEDANALERAP